MSKKIVAITACPTGIAHTYMAAEKLRNVGKELGYEVRVETQGTTGAQDALTAREIAGADGILCRLRPGALRPGAPGVLPPAAAASTGRRPAAVAGGQGGHPEEAEVSTVSTGIQACIARL